MKIEDLIELLKNRLREFKLSRDYAKMSGDLERMNTADKEVMALEDTLFKLNLLVDASKSAVVKEETLAEAITDGSVSALGEYDISPYATDPLHEEKILKILSKIGVMDTAEKIDGYIHGKYLSSPVTGEMVMSAAVAYKVDARLMMAMMEQDSRFGTAGLAVRTLNPGNVGNDDDGNTRTYESWQQGVTAVAEWLNRHRISESKKVLSEEIATSTPQTAGIENISTSTPEIIIPTQTATTTPNIATSTPETTRTETLSTTTPEIIIPTQTATTAPNIATSTPQTTGIENISTSTPEIIIPTQTATTTPNIATSTPETVGTETLSTATPEIIIPTQTATTTQGIATSTNSEWNTLTEQTSATTTSN